MNTELRRRPRLTPVLQPARNWMVHSVKTIQMRPWQLIFCLPLVGLAASAPLLWNFPLYPDEIQWNIINSRILLDRGKLIYFFPACEAGFLTNTPISWYPSRLLDAALFSNMDDPWRLRYASIAEISALVTYTAWLAQRMLRPSTPLFLTIGAVIAPLSLGALPFLLVYSRPEKAILLPVFIACTLPLWIRASSPLSSWLLAALYGLLAWMVSAAHPKAVFLFPALIASGYAVIRSAVPTVAMTAAAVFGAYETFRLWNIRTDCPQSQFLAAIFRNLSISPSSLLNDGFLPFVASLANNMSGARAYWHQISFQTQYQTDWLPEASYPLSYTELLINSLIPAVTTVGLLIVALAATIDMIAAIRSRNRPPGRVVIAVMLVIGLLAIASFQITKNFYEAGLQAPILGLAVVLALPSLINRITYGRTMGAALVGSIAALSILSQFANVGRLAPHLATWEKQTSASSVMRMHVGLLMGKCGIENSARTSNVVMDDAIYSQMWRTREPLFTQFFHGWWATALDQEKMLQQRKVSAIIGACSSMRPEDQSSSISSGGYCCKRFAPLASPN